VVQGMLADPYYQLLATNQKKAQKMKNKNKKQGQGQSVIHIEQNSSIIDQFRTGENNRNVMELDRKNST
jgi:hypothetical protein